MSTFRNLRELLRALKTADKLLADMFQKRRTVAIRYDDAVDALDGNENHLRYLIAHGVIVQAGGLLELGDSYLSFFENVLEVNEVINTASVRQYIDKLRGDIDLYLAADGEKRKAQFMRDIRHTFRSIDQATHRNVIDLRRNVEHTYKQEPDFKIKKLRLKDFDRKSRDIAELIHQTEATIDSETVFFGSTTDMALRETVHEVQAGLRLSAHALIDIQKLIIDYLNRIEYQGRLVRKIRQLKYLKDQFMLEEATDIVAVAASRDDVWMEPKTLYSTKVSVDYLRNDDEALTVLTHVRAKTRRKQVAARRIAGTIPVGYLDTRQEAVPVLSHEEVFNAFTAQGLDLFTYTTTHDFHIDMTREARMVLYLQLASQYPTRLRFTGEMRTTGNVTYPIILPL